MRQIFNIFQKDARHFWRQSAVSVAFVIAFAWYDVRSWAQEDLLNYASGSFLFDAFLVSSLVTVLLPISWALVVLRVIQADSLVGDRQFWVTRPYDWKKLLSAKILFILVFINSPLLIADIFLVMKAGFHPTQYSGGLIAMQTAILLGLSLMVALATVTASVVQAGLALLIVVLYAVGMGAMAEQIPGSSFPSSIGDSTEVVLLIVAPLVVILFQYLRRATTKSRLLIACFAAVPILILVGTPYRTVVAHQYPKLEVGQPPPLQLVLSTPEKEPDASAQNGEKEVEISIPFKVSGLAEDSIVKVNGAMVAIEDPDGLQWNSGWLSKGWSLFREDKDASISFHLKKKLFERVKSKAVEATVSLALTVYHDQDRREFVVPKGEFPIPGVGLCAATGWYQPDIACRAPIPTSSLLVTYDLSQTACPVKEGESRAKPGEMSRSWGEGSAKVGISPVRILRFGTVNNVSNARAVAGLCPGTPVVLSNPKAIGRTRIEVALPGLRLANYRLPPVRTDGGTIGFSVWH